MSEAATIDGLAAVPTDPDPARPPSRWPLIPALALVLLLGGAAAWGNRGQFNPDGISYLQLASHLGSGELRASISAYWSPLFVWTLTPLLSLGLDRLLAARLALLLWAAVGVVAADRLARHLGLTPLARAAALVTIALGLAELATRVTTPDVLVGSCLLAYAAATTHPQLLRSRRHAALTGALAGVCFLGKSYALPFVLLHLPLMVAVRALRHPEPGRWRREVAPTLAIAMAALLVIASSWIAVLSVRFERPTWATSGASVHAACGPGVALGDYRLPEGLRTPPPPHRSIWEMPELAGYPRWSPLATPEHRAHQLNIILHHARSALRIVGAWDWLGLTLPALALAPLLAWLVRRHLATRAPALLEASVWIPCTVALYIGGHLPIFLEERYLLTFLLPLVVLLLVGASAALAAELRARSPGGGAGPGRLFGPALVGLICASYAGAPLSTLVDRARHGDDGRATAGMVRALNDAGVRGPLALVIGEGAPSGAWHHGQYVGFHLDETYVGTLTAEQARTTTLLDDHGVASVFVLRADAAPLDLGPRWALRCTLGDPGGLRFEVFGRAEADPAARRPAPR